MTLRKTLFWIHLTAGLACGLVVAMLAITGFFLTYERQIKDWADRSELQFNGESVERSSIDHLLAKAFTERPNWKARSLTLSADPQLPPFLSQSYLDRTYIHPATGSIMGPGDKALHESFARLLRIHRWFDLQDAGRTIGKSITGAANILFLYLLVSGVYLWLPRVWSTVTARQRLIIQPRAGSHQERYFNWHHVLGIWSFAPLIVIVTSGIVFSYDRVQQEIQDLARDDDYVIDAPPLPGPVADTNFLPLENHVSLAQESNPHWRRLVLTLPDHGIPFVKILVDMGTGGQPQHQQLLVLDRISGDFIRSESISTRPPGSRVIEYLRWLHTGELFGVVGQTVAACVCLSVLIMVWSGWALALRRFTRRTGSD